MEYHCGEEPGVGTYICTRDNFKVTLDNLFEKMENAITLSNQYIQKY